MALRELTRQKLAYSLTDLSSFQTEKRKKKKRMTLACLEAA